MRASVLDSTIFLLGLVAIGMCSQCLRYPFPKIQGGFNHDTKYYMIDYHLEK